MDKLIIICLDDQRDVLAALRRDLNEIREHAVVISCESVAETLEILSGMDARGEEPAILICDHVMPGTSGIDFLVDLRKEGRFKATRRILLTGLATQKDTIDAINQARIDHYIEKPWEKENLLRVVRKYLTLYVTDRGLNFQSYPGLMDSDVLIEALKKNSV